jgi:hypothetical protein
MVLPLRKSMQDEMTIHFPIHPKQGSSKKEKKMRKDKEEMTKRESQQYHQT